MNRAFTFLQAVIIGPQIAKYEDLWRSFIIEVESEHKHM